MTESRPVVPPLGSGPTLDAPSHDYREESQAHRVGERATSARTVTGDEWNITQRLLSAMRDEVLDKSQAEFAMRCVQDLGEAEWRVRRDRDRIADELEQSKAELVAARSLLRDATRDTERLDWMDGKRETVRAISGAVGVWYLRDEPGESRMSLRQVIDAALSAAPIPAEEPKR